MIAYDAVLSFSQEVKCIWKRKAGVVTILYLFVRYGTIVDIVFQIIGVFYSAKTLLVSNATLRYCEYNLTHSFQR